MNNVRSRKFATLRFGKIRLIEVLLHMFILLQLFFICQPVQSQSKSMGKTNPVYADTFGFIIKEFGRSYEEVLQIIEHQFSNVHLKEHLLYDGRRLIEINNPIGKEWVFYYFTKAKQLSGYQRVFTDIDLYSVYRQTWLYLKEIDDSTVKTVPENSITSYDYNPIHQLTDIESYYNSELNVYVAFGGLHVPESKPKYKLIIGVFKSGHSPVLSIADGTGI